MNPHHSTPRLPTWFTWLFQPTRWPPQRISRQQFDSVVYLWWGVLSGHNFPKLRLLRCQNFLRIFLSFRSVGFCLRAWALGPRLPRPNAAALGSLAGPRSGRRAAPRGQGGRGCTEQRWPWPRTRIWGGKPLEAMGSLRDEVDEMLKVQVFF